MVRTLCPNKNSELINASFELSLQETWVLHALFVAGDGVIRFPEYKMPYKEQHIETYFRRPLLTPKLSYTYPT